ncbi:MAG: N-acetyltransferase [Burkholderiales bacterium]|uniref:GNAT family N-acetyltransferase n=1 Tax=Inhella sp. TaxID=1921806 RepID=UPI001AC0DA88|nr:N-acetyltransferase [Burkholderiales bacterium]
MGTIVHSEGRFELCIDGQACELDYRRVGDRVVFTHTGVPPALQGRGLAAELVMSGLQWARQEQLKVVPACSYVARYIDRHPQWQDLLDGGADPKPCFREFE